MNGVLNQLALYRELEPAVGASLDRHRLARSSWSPEDYVRPESYWGHTRPMLTETAKAALVTTLLTHNNTARSDRGNAQAPSRSAWSNWMDEWTAEKNFHADAIQRYLVATRSVDPIALDRARFQCMTIGIDSSMEGDHLLRSIAHATVDVMATMVSHRNTAVECNDPIATALLGRIVADQELHVAFHRDIAAAALDIAPAQTVKAITEVIMNFQMPGSGLPGFGRSAMLLGRDGIYDLRRHLDEVLLPSLRDWRIFERTDLGAGERSRATLSDFLDDLEKQATHFERVRLRTRAHDAERLRAS
ncbi:acyl-ACP desaturase [Rhodococcus sp. G-MC3]|uniref:acyl-ACP desaturase n=1 Tax=Rhodococcus sp. G-MC3 TaxID=3046209 RepID=UPI0024B93417|nr:acyl-ACP desaturase [Rhodococcus sp. G-MC3]MDJ0393900.1 acyl-ACP desaturase [Rhodococcus sp. G-MC3]